MTYRQDAGARERQRARLALRVAELEGAWTDVFWEELADEEGIAPRRSVSPEPDLEAEIARLAARAEVLERLEARADRVVRAWSRPGPLEGEAVEHVPGVRGGYGWSDMDGWLGRVRACVDRHREGVPVRACARSWVNEGTVGLSIHVVTSIARGARALTVRPETLLDDLRKMLGSRHDVELGAEAFDGVFAVEGDEATARAVLDGDARAALLRLGARSTVEVRLGGGQAWVGVVRLTNGAIDEHAIASAVRVARAARRAPARPLRADDVRGPRGPAPLH